MSQSTSPQALASISLLQESIKNYKSLHPRARAVEIAKALGLSELEILISQIDGKKVIPLRPDWNELWQRLPALGKVMALTRNAGVVSECRGSYGAAKIHGKMGLVHGDNIDLRLFMSDWQSVFAVELESAKGTLQSLQIFNGRGQAVHKIYHEDPALASTYQQLIQDFRLPEPYNAPELQGLEKPTQLRQVNAQEQQQLLADWQLLQDTHEFHGLLKRHQVDRLQALELAMPQFVTELGPRAVSQVLEGARDASLPLMAFVGNANMIQIYSGPVHKLLRSGDWFNVLDPSFNLHIDERTIDRVFIVHKPTQSGIISSLEVFNSQRELILSFFGYRKDDQQPAAEWALLLAALHA